MKKHTLTLDLDLDDESPLLDNIAILFFHTDTPNYLFADDLNHLYHLALARTDDIPLYNTSWPLFSFHDQLRLFNYYLVEHPLTQSSNQTIKQSKILIIRGEDAENESDKILRDFNEPPADTDAIHPDSQRRNETLLSYQQALVSVTRYNTLSPTPLSRKATKERQEIDNLLTDILDYLDLNHM